MAKTILYVDMDGVTVDFCKSNMFTLNDRKHTAPPRMFEQFFFETLPPVEGAMWAIRELLQCEQYDIHILTQPVKETHYSYSEKAAWVSKWIPELANKIIMTQNKELLSAPGRILIDDMAERWRTKWEAGGGTYIHFDYKRDGDNRTEWINTLSKLLPTEGQ